MSLCMKELYERVVWMCPSGSGSRILRVGPPTKHQGWTPKVLCYVPGVCMHHVVMLSFLYVCCPLCL